MLAVSRSTGHTVELEICRLGTRDTPAEIWGCATVDPSMEEVTARCSKSQSLHWQVKTPSGDLPGTVSPMGTRRASPPKPSLQFSLDAFALHFASVSLFMWASHRVRSMLRFMQASNTYARR